MGLTLFWELQLKRELSRTPAVDDSLMLFELPPVEPAQDPLDAIEAMRLLRERCLDLPFESVSELMHLSAEPAAGSRASELWEDADCRAARSDERRFPLAPIEVVGFTVWAGGDCEAGSIFLARYPSTYWAGLKRERTGWPLWSGHGLCKTQYASLRGQAHFIRCHLTMIAALDEARRLGLLSDVHDEGNFWGQRSVESLTQEVEEWNAMLAGLGGALKDALGDGAVAAPIFSHPEFERLEALASGNANLTEFWETVRKLTVDLRV